MTARTRSRLHLDPATVRQARALARKAGMTDALLGEVMAAIGFANQMNRLVDG